VIRTNSKRYIQVYNRTPEDVRDQTLMTMEKGYTFKENNLIPEAAGVARPIMDGAGRVVAAISVISIMRRFETPRRQEIIELLRREIEAFTTTSFAPAGI
jgi:DNA-binding IclR family transcriptional regulator